MKLNIFDLVKGTDPKFILASSSTMSVFKLKFLLFVIFFKILFMTLLHSNSKIESVFCFLSCLNKFR